MNLLVRKELEERLGLCVFQRENTRVRKGKVKKQVIEGRKESEL